VQDYDRQRERAPASTAGGWRALAAAIIAVLLLGIVAGAYFYGKHAASTPATGRPAQSTESDASATGETAVSAPLAPAVLSADAAEKISAAFGLLRDGEQEKARDLFAAVQRENPAFPGLWNQIAKIEHRLNRGQIAITNVDQAIRAGEPPADMLMLKGQILAAQGAFPAAYGAFAEAVAANPFDPYIYFYWGEALRVDGRLQQAVAKLDEAHRRATQQSDTFIIHIKWLLARIEADQNDALKSEIAAELAKPEPSGDWLLAGAVLALMENRTEDDAIFLDRARVALQPAFFGFCISDKFFDLYRTHPLLGRRLIP